MKLPRRSATVSIVFLTILILALPQPTAASAPFSQNLQLRNSGDDVTRLQQFLNAENYFVAQSGPGSPGNETTTFGLLTYQALTEFQSAHGLPATGFFGPLTRALIATVAASSTGTSTLSSSVATSTAPSIATSTAVVSPATTTPSFSPFSNTTSGYIPGVTPLPGYAPGQLIFIGGASTPPPTPPAPAPYVAQAVHFDGNASLLRGGPLTGVVNGPTGTISVWYKALNFFNFPDLIVPLPSYHVDIFFNPTPKFYFTDTSVSNTLYYNYGAAPIDTAWHHLLCSWNLGFAAGSRRIACYIDDVLQVPTVQDDSGGSPIDIQYVDTDFTAASNPDETTVGDEADLEFWTQTTIVEADNTITESNRRKFIDSSGKPVDPTDAVAALGSPAILFSGDASSFGTNKGTGGSFTTTGILADASTSPSN